MATLGGGQGQIPASPRATRQMQHEYMSTHAARCEEAFQLPVPRL